jgi:protease-4
MKIYKLTGLILLLISLINSNNCRADYRPLPSYYSQSAFLFAPPSVFQEGLLGFTNPANLNFLHSTEFKYYLSVDREDNSSNRKQGFFLGFPNAGFGIIKNEWGGNDFTDYRLSIAFGNDLIGFGLGYGWSDNEVEALENDRLLKSGLILRPMKYFSIGLTGDFSLENDARQGVAEFGIRPLGTPLLTLFGDFAAENKTRFDDIPWSAGAVLEPIKGMNITGRYFDNETFTIGLDFCFGKGSVGGQLHFDDEQRRVLDTYSIRLGGMRRHTILDDRSRFLKINLKGEVVYNKYRFFDKGRHRFMDIITDIRAAVDDPRVAAIAVNTSSMLILPEHAWEIREELKRVRLANKQVVVFLDLCDITGYHLASVADEVVMDPDGILYLPGYAGGRTYVKRLMEKAGLGVDELRFYKYKSFAEQYSRESMSDADREQRQALVDDQYELTRADVCESRELAVDQYDRIINDEFVLDAGLAFDYGLVDRIGRWSDIKEFINPKLRPIPSGELLNNALPPEQWGPRPVIAVVYGIGECAMDSGIRGRWLARVFKKLSKDVSVEAVVFRVDSPGGLVQPSDMVAEAIKKCAEKKPVIVSQGQVAASGGYYISIYGDRIVAGPNTVTGSIGVIGVWIWDEGFSEKLGLDFDYVKRGEHADLLRGSRIPLFNLSVPHRPLTPDERFRLETLIRGWYEKFIFKVSEGRGIPVDSLRRIAEGRVYSGTAGKKIGLVDKIGTLSLAVEIVKKEAGIKPDQEVVIREIPEYKGLFMKPSFNLFNLDNESALYEDSPLYRYIKLISENPGRPLPIVEPGLYPTLEDR